MRLLKRIFFLLLILPFQVVSQSSLLWENLHCPNNYDPISLYFDTTQNNLYMLSSWSDSSRISKWDGATWVTLPFTGCSSGLNLTNYNGELLAATGGCFSILKLNGTNWQPFQSILPNNNVNCFLQNGNDLYIGGVFDSIGASAIRCVSKWNGSSWEAFGNFPYSTSFGFNNVRSLAMYMGDLIAGGLIGDNAGNVVNIVKWDGFSWSALGGGIHGGMDDVFDMIIYNNELYVAGSFTKAHGNVGNYIQKWDGNWHEVGGGVMGLFGGNGQIWDLEVHENALYATGYFSTAGGVPAQHIAKWDGTNWCSLGTELANAICLTKSSTDLYVGGGFKVINGDSTGSITKWIGGNYVDTCGFIPIGIEEMTISTELKVYPNPATNQITLEFNINTSKDTFIEINNILGQSVKKTVNSFPIGVNMMEIDLSELPKGLYFIQLQNDNKISSKKIIKQ
ncbi:MAG TPA: T9SS type A sorting domain-containing protein [Flavobacterium sp.]|jgi:hypothetical protein